MSLFTDADVISLDDLLQFESSLVDVCSTHGIDVKTKIKVATDGIGDKLMLWLLCAAQSDPQAPARRTLGLSSVVISPALYRWLCFDALARVFAEAYNVQLNTRFQGKWSEYQKEAKDAAALVYASGIGVVSNPLSKPSLPTIELSAGTVTLSSLFVQTTWTNGNGEESAPSVLNAAVLNGFSDIRVRTNTSFLQVPATATGWNVYASETQQTLLRQNVYPIPLGSVWQMPISGLVLNTACAGEGQRASVFITLGGRLQRG